MPMSMLLMAYLPYLLPTLLIGVLGWRWLRVVETKSVEKERLEQLAERLTLLEETVERQRDEQQQVADGLHFVQRLLKGRGASDETGNSGRLLDSLRASGDPGV